MGPKGKAVVLASGGLDSAALLAWALDRYRHVQPVYCRLGLRWGTGGTPLVKEIRPRPSAPRTSSPRRFGIFHEIALRQPLESYRKKRPRLPLPGPRGLFAGTQRSFAVPRGRLCGVTQYDGYFVGHVGQEPFPRRHAALFLTPWRGRCLWPLENLSTFSPLSAE